MVAKKLPPRWRLYRRQRPRTYRLARGVVDLVAAQEDKAGKWFWYTLGKGPPANTSGKPELTLDAVKTQVTRWLNVTNL